MRISKSKSICKSESIEGDFWKSIAGNFWKSYAKYVVCGVVVVMATAYIFYDNIWLSVLMSPYVYFYVKERKKEVKQEEKRRLTVQFKDAMQSVSFALNVGYSIENAFREAVKELTPLYGEGSRIVIEFKSMIRRVEHNSNIEDVLMEFAENSSVDDIIYFAEVFQYAKRSGGDLIQIIKNTASAISDKIEVESEIQTVISGKKLEQRVMCVMPYGIILYLRLASPQFIVPLYGSPVGIIVMTVCLIIYLGANYMAKKIVNISV